MAGTGGGTGSRTVASYDEDTTTLGVAAARQALASAPAGVVPGSVFSTRARPTSTRPTPPPSMPRCGWTTTSGVRRPRVGPVGGRGAPGRPGPSRPALVVAADIRTGRPGSRDEADGGDGAPALLVGSAEDGPLIAEVIGTASLTEEFLDRLAGARRPVLTAVGGAVRGGPLHRAGVQGVGRRSQGGRPRGRPGRHGGHRRRPQAGRDRRGPQDRRRRRLAPGLDASVGYTGAAHAGLALADALDRAGAGDIVALVVLADGADVFVLRATEALAACRPSPSVADQVAAGAPVAYGKVLAWRGLPPVEPPRRPEPPRPSASAAGRSGGWKFGFVGSQGDDGASTCPRRRATPTCPMADARGTIVTFTVDRLAYSPSPPVIFAVVDFDGGGRLPSS